MIDPTGHEVTYDPGEPDNDEQDTELAEDFDFYSDSDEFEEGW